MATGTTPSTSSCPRWASPSRRGRSRSGSSSEGEHDRGRRAAARDLDRQGRHRGAEPRRPASCTQILVQEGETVDVGTKLARDRAGRARRRRRAAAAQPAAGGAAQPAAEQAARAAASAEPSSRRETPPPAAAPSPAAAPADGPRARTARRFVSPVVARIAAEHGVDVARGPGHRPRRPRDEEGHPRVRRVGRPGGAPTGARGPRRRPPRRPGSPGRLAARRRRACPERASRTGSGPSRGRDRASSSSR